MIGILFGPAKNRLMAEVEPVEHPDGEVDRSRNFAEFEDGLKSAHRRKKEELVMRHCLGDRGAPPWIAGRKRD